MLTAFKPSTITLQYKWSFIMKKENNRTDIKYPMTEWLTIPEAVQLAQHKLKFRLTKSDIYKNALRGNIILSIYFQSPITLRKIQKFKNKLKFRPIENPLTSRLCALEKKALSKKTI